MKEEGRLLIGINPVLEALRRGERRFEKIYIAKGRGGPKTDELVNLARERDVHIRFEQREIIDRICGSANHQGVAGVVSAKEYSTTDDMLGLAKKGMKSLSLLYWTALKTRRTSEEL